MALSQMCTAKGGIECDVTVTMISPDRFYLVSAAATETHDLAWIERHAPADGSVQITNLTADLGVLTIAGPRSRDLLARVCDHDLTNPGFPFFTAQEIEVGAVPTRAMRVSYVGELGWELHHPLEYQRSLYNTILEAGEDLGLVDFGYRALEAMRLEKGYRLWGADMSADWTPFEAGLGRFVKLDKGDFSGRTRLLEQHKNGVIQRLACLEVDDAEAIPYMGEPVYVGNDVIAYVMSGGYGPTVRSSIAFAYIPVALAKPGTELTVELLGDRVPARVAEEPLYDPGHHRLRM
jgi:glycine cleavage system aminomethyltransferase T